MTKQTPEWENEFDEKFDIRFHGKPNMFPMNVEVVKSFIRETFLPKADLLAEIERMPTTIVGDYQNSGKDVKVISRSDLTSWIKEQ